MFVRTTSHRNDSFSSKYRAGKATSSRPKRSFRESNLAASIQMTDAIAGPRSPQSVQSPTGTVESNLTSPIITISVGPNGRLFAAHEDILGLSPVFASYLRREFVDSKGQKKLHLPEEQPEVLSSVLEFLYKGDYYPRLLQDKKRDTWFLENGNDNNPRRVESTVLHDLTEREILKDTLIYCAAEKYSLPDLKRLALRKQGLQAGIQCSTILDSARYAYANTPDTDSKLRAHYLALIIRSKGTFKKSGTMQAEMMRGGCGLFFDLFVAMCNHMDDLGTVASVRSPASNTIRSPASNTIRSPFGSPFTR